MRRRDMLGVAGMAWIPGSNPPQRPDQLLQQLTRSGSGPAPQSAFIVARRVIIIGPGGSGVFVYSPSAATGNLVDSMTATAGTDPYGNAYLAGVASYQQVTPTDFLAVSMNSGQVNFWHATAAGGPWTSVVSAISDASGNFTVTAQTLLELTSTTGNVLVQATAAGQKIALVSPQTVVQASIAGATTSALLEVQGDLQAGDGLSIGQGAAVQTLVNGSTINTAGITMQPVTAAAAVTGIILQAGTFDGQVITIPSNAGVGNTATFAASGTSHVALGVAAVINPGACAVLVWVSSTSLWYFAQ